MYSNDKLWKYLHYNANMMYLFKLVGVKYDLIYGKSENGSSNIPFKVQI